MGAFDDLIPASSPVSTNGAFDDLIPSAKIDFDGGTPQVNAQPPPNMGDLLRQSFVQSTLEKAKTPEQRGFAEKLIENRLAPNLPTPGILGQISSGIGAGLHDTGKAVGDIAKAYTFEAIGAPDLQMDQLTGKDPWEAGRKSLPLVPRAAAGAVSGLIETAPQMAIAAVNPVAGAASFGFTPDGFDPVQAGTMLLAPAGGQMLGRVAARLAAKAGVSTEKALSAISMVGGATGVAGLMSAPSVYQIAQMPAGEERDAAIEDTAANALLIGVMGGMHKTKPGAFDDLIPKKPETTPTNVKSSPQAPNISKAPNISPADEVLQQIQSNVVPQRPVVRTPDGAVDPVQSAIEEMRQQFKQTQPAPTIAEKASEQPAAPVTLADLAQLQAEMRGNQLKPSEPAEIPAASQSSPPVAATAPAAAEATPLSEPKVEAPAAKSGFVPPKFESGAKKQFLGGNLFTDTVLRQEYRALKNKFGEAAGHLENPVTRNQALSNISEIRPQDLDAANRYIQLHDAIESLSRTQEPKSKPLTPAAKSATTGLPAPETTTVRTDARKGVTDEGQASAMTADTGETPVRGAGTASSLRNKPTITEADGLLHTIVGSVGKIPIFKPDGIVVAQYRRLAKKYKNGQGFLSPAEKAQFTRLSEIFPKNYEDDFGVGGERIKAAYDAAKKAGIAGELFQPVRHGDHMKLDAKLDEIERQTGQRFSAPELLDEITRLANAKRGRGKVDDGMTDRERGTLAVEEQQTVDFQRNNTKATKRTQAVPVETLAEGDYFTLNGAKLRVTDIQVDNAGQLQGITLEDGKQYGTQHIERDEQGNIRLRMDKGSLQQKPGADVQPHNLGKELPYHTSAADALKESQTLKPTEGKLLKGYRPDPNVLGTRGMKIYEQSNKLRERIDNLLYDLKTQSGQGDIFTGDAAHKAIVKQIHEARTEYEARLKQLADIEAQQSGLDFGNTKTTKPTADTNDPVDAKLTEWIEKTGLKPGALYEGVTGAPVWLTKSAINGVLRVARAAYRGGKTLAEAIQQGIDWLRTQELPDFNEAEARDWFEKQDLTEEAKPERPDQSRFNLGRKVEDGRENAERPERERGVDAIKTELSQAETDLHEATRRKEGQSQKEYKQGAAIATAKFRKLGDELHTHPDYVAEQILKQHEAITAANDILKPIGLSMTPEDFPNIATVREKLGVAAAETVNRFADVVATTTSELARSKRLLPKLVDRVTGEMMADGRLPKMAEIDLSGAGRSLDQVTDWLKANQVDSPRLTLRERLNLPGRLAAELQRGKDLLTRAWTNALAAGKAAKEIYQHPPIDTDFRNVVKSWIYADQRTGLATHQFVKAITEKVSSPLRRQAMAVWLDAGGDESLLNFQAMTVPPRWEKVYRTALKLTPDEKALAQKIRSDFEAKRDDAIATGLMEQGRDDYGVPQRWEIAPERGDQQAAQDGKRGTPGKPNAKLDPRDPFFSFEREHPTYFDGIMAGGVPENLDVAHLVSVYDGAFHKALSSRGAIAALQLARANDGLPVVKISGSASSAPAAEGGRAYFVDSRAWNKTDVAVDGRPYRSLDHFALKGWKVAFKDGEGNPIIVKGDMLIHPDHFDYLKNELGQSALREGIPGKILNPVMKTQAFMKASKLSASFFHMFTIGEHMASHLANPFLNGFKLDLRDPNQSLLVRNGLEIGMGYPRQAFEEGLASGHGGLFGKIPGLGDLSSKMTDYMFRDYIPAIMMKVGLRTLEANRKRYGKELSDAQIAELTAQQMNAAGGLLNYRLRGADNNIWGKLGGNKTLMDLNRMALLAPQFLEARGRVIAQALKPYGAEQRKMLIMQAALLYVGCRVLNQLLDDDAHWTDEPFSVVHNGRAYSIRTIVGDFWHMLTDPKSFAAGRLSPASKIGVETVTQRDLRTGARKEPMIQTDWAPSRMAQIAIEDMARWLVPISVEGMLPGATGREQTAGDMVLSSLGVGSHKATASAEMYQLAAKFNRNSPDPKANRQQLARDAAPWGTSDYRKLDALLDAGDINAAKQEYDALIKSGHDAEVIRRRYNRFAPFTGKVDREEKFKASLDSEGKKMYARAKAEHDERVKAFNKMAK